MVVVSTGQAMWGIYQLANHYTPMGSSNRIMKMGQTSLTGNNTSFYDVINDFHILEIILSPLPFNKILLLHKLPIRPLAQMLFEHLSLNI